jgi:SAM-dependent methyltransferase
MTDDRFLDPEHFFDRFPKFLETSETGQAIERFKGRYIALIDSNRDLIRGAHVLDLASHDGRWSFAALQNGAARVVGIEHKQRLVRKSLDNMEFYDVPPAKYDFVLGDIYERIDDVEQCDVVFCFGLFYHINEHMLLLSKIARREPKVLIMDTNISLLEGALIELVHEGIGGQLVGQPSKVGLEEMFSSFGWTWDYFDWKQSELCGPKPLSDYRAGRRVTAIVNCRHS